MSEFNHQSSEEMVNFSMQETQQQPQTSERNDERERAVVGTLLSLNRRLEQADQLLYSRQGVDKLAVRRDDISNAEIAMKLEEETSSLHAPELLDFLNEKQRAAIELAAHQVNEAIRTLHQTEDLSQPHNPSPEDKDKLHELANVRDRIQSAATIVGLVWELQPRKTHEDFERPQ